jgi:hypothetical protein
MVMKKKGKFPIRYIPFVFLLITGGVVQGASLLDGGFTYQGQIKQNGALVNGSCDFLFRLFDAQNDGSQVGANYPSNGVIVQNGLFSTTLNFGDVFKGNKTWLAIDVRCPSGRGSYTPLGSRQPLTATPYALSLRPSATIQGGIDSLAAVIKCINTSTGSGVLLFKTNGLKGEDIFHNDLT